VIDFHCHLDLYSDPHAVAEECRQRGVYVLSVTTTPSAWHGTLKLARQGDRIRSALGLHPQIAHERRGELPLFDSLLTETRYVGEIGLDGSPELRPHWNAQVAVFEHILKACTAAGGRIMSIHSRRAAGEVLDRLEAHPGAGTPILHWFSGGVRELDRAVALGCWFSVGPAMLKGERGRKLAARMPADRLLTETDGPFAEIGGQSLRPWEVTGAVSTLANVWSVPAEEANKRVKANLKALGRVQ
jgi:TatD DNase family protein